MSAVLKSPVEAYAVVPKPVFEPGENRNFSGYGSLLRLRVPNFYCAGAFDENDSAIFRD